MARAVIPVKERLARKLTPADGGCLLWGGKISRKGYGRIWVVDRLRATHRVAYELANGPIPAGLQIDHLCRNRRCCAPDHLEAVTLAENVARGNAPNAVNARKTHCIRGHAFTPENTIRKKGGKRACRTCFNVAHARWKKARRAAAMAA